MNALVFAALLGLATSTEPAGETEQPPSHAVPALAETDGKVAPRATPAASSPAAPSAAVAAPAASHAPSPSEQGADESAHSQVDEAVASKKKLSKWEVLSLGGVFYGNLNVDVTRLADQRPAAGFEVTRMYLTLKSKPTAWLSTRTTLDFSRFDADGHQALHGYIKYAYFELKPVSSLKVRFGQQSRVWIGTIEKAFGYRWVTKSSADHFKYLPSADLGASVLGHWLGGVLEAHVGAFNGTGYKDPAAPQGRPIHFAYEARVSVAPYKYCGGPLEKLKLHLTANTSGASQGSPGQRITQTGGALAFSHKYVDAVAELLTRREDTAGYETELLLTPHVALKLDPWALFGVYAVAQNNNGTARPSWQHRVIGLSYRPAKSFAAALTYVDDRAKKWKRGAGRAVLINTMVKL